MKQDRDLLVRKVISDVSEITGFHEATVNSAVSHFLSWQWRSFSNAEYPSYMWKNFGTFTWKPPVGKKSTKFYTEFQRSLIPGLLQFHKCRRGKEDDDYTPELPKAPITKPERTKRSEALVSEIKKYSPYDISMKLREQKYLMKFRYHCKGKARILRGAFWCNRDGENGWNDERMEYLTEQELEMLLKAIKKIMNDGQSSK